MYSKIAIENKIKWTVAICLPFLLVLFYVMRFSGSVPFWDEWEFFTHYYNFTQGSESLLKLATIKHNEHIIGFVYLIDSVLFSIFGYSSLLISIINLILQLALLILFVNLFLGKEYYKFSWKLGAVFSTIAFSLSQSKNYLWAFQLPWFLIPFLLIIGLTAIKKAADPSLVNNINKYLIITTVCGFLATFSSLQGIFVWASFIVAALIYKYINKEIRNKIRLALISGFFANTLLLAIVYYKNGFGSISGEGRISLKYSLLNLLGLYGSYIGNYGVTYGYLVGVLTIIMIFLIATTMQRNQDINFPNAIAIFIWVLLFNLAVGIGRSKFGSDIGLDNHYSGATLLSLLVIASVLFKESNFERFYIFRSIFFTVMILIWSISTFDALKFGINWHTDRSIAKEALCTGSLIGDKITGRLTYADINRVKALTNSLQVMGILDLNCSRNNSVLSINMPISLNDFLIKHPTYTQAIQQAWYVYLVSPDLRGHFNSKSKDFFVKYMKWVNDASANENHYMSKQLIDYHAQYSEIISKIE